MSKFETPFINAVTWNTSGSKISRISPKRLDKMSSFETERTLQIHAKKIVLGLIKIHEFTENQRIVLKIFFVCGMPMSVILKLLVTYIRIKWIHGSISLCFFSLL